MFLIHKNTVFKHIALPNLALPSTLLLACLILLFLTLVYSGQAKSASNILIFDSKMTGVTSGRFETFKGYNAHGAPLKGIGNQENRYQFSSDLPRIGFYRVYAWWPASSSNANNVVYEIHHDLGIDIKTVDQTVLGGQWNELGTFLFSESDIFVLNIYDPDTQKPVADAIKFQFVGAQPPKLKITTSALPLGNIGDTYTSQLNVSGGTPPYTWLTNETLPEGLNIIPSTGVISGIPSQTQSTDVLLHVYDQNGASAEKTITIQILKKG